MCIVNFDVSLPIAGMDDYVRACRAGSRRPSPLARSSSSDTSATAACHHGWRSRAFPTPSVHAADRSSPTTSWQGELAA